MIEKNLRPPPRASTDSRWKIFISLPLLKNWSPSQSLFKGNFSTIMLYSYFSSLPARRAISSLEFLPPPFTKIGRFFPPILYPRERMTFFSLTPQEIPVLTITLLFLIITFFRYLFHVSFSRILSFRGFHPPRKFVREEFSTSLEPVTAFIPPLLTFFFS